MNISQKFRRRNYWMVVKVSVKDLKVPIIVPIPLFLVEDLVTSIVSLYRVGRKVYPKLKEYTRMRLNSFDIDLEEYIDMPVELIQELRRLGKFTMVEVKDEDAHVSVKFY